MTRMLRPTRERMAEALAVASCEDVGFWRDAEARWGGTHAPEYERGEGAVRWGPGASAAVRVPDARALWEACALHGLIGAEDVEHPGRAFERRGASLSALVRRWAARYVGRAVTPGVIDRVRVEAAHELAAHSSFAFELIHGAIAVRWDQWGLRVVVPPFLAREAGDGIAVLPHPPTVSACVALSAGWRGVLMAEQIAREVAAYVSAGRRVPPRVHWKIASPAEIERALAARVGERPIGTWRDLCSLFAEVALAQTLRVAGVVDLLGSAERSRFAGAPYSITRVVEMFSALARTGYALDEVTEEGITLAAPEL